MHQDSSSFAYTDVGEGREQDAEASYLTSLGMTEKSKGLRIIHILYYMESIHYPDIPAAQCAGLLAPYALSKMELPRLPYIDGQMP